MKSLRIIAAWFAGYAFMMYEFFYNEAFIMEAVFFAGMAILSAMTGIIPLTEERRRHDASPLMKKLATLVFGGCNRGFSMRGFAIAFLCVIGIIALYWADSLGIYATMLQIILFDFLMYMVGVVIGIIMMFIGGLPG